MSPHGPELFQVSTLAALAHGANRGGITIGQLLAHGDLGIGTFDGLDGELVVLDGCAFRVTGHERVTPVAADELTPYAAVTAFRAEVRSPLPPCADIGELTAALDGLRTDPDRVAAIRVDGRFERLGLRVACGAREGETLAQAAGYQFEAHHAGVEATMVGFWTPEDLLGVDVVGYHLHVLSHDRTVGGHVFEASGSELTARVQTEGRLHVVGEPAPQIDVEQLADDLGGSERFRRAK